MSLSAFICFHLRPQHRPVDAGDCRSSGQHHCQLEFPAENLHNPSDAIGAADSQTVKIGPPDLHCGRAER